MACQRALGSVGQGEDGLPAEMAIDDRVDHRFGIGRKGDGDEQVPGLHVGDLLRGHATAEVEQAGRQIHLLSVRSQLALRGRGYSGYCATKGGLAMLVKQHAMELAPHNITVNGLAPTFIRSERIRHHLEREGFRDFILERNPLGRIGDPLEVVGQIIAFAAPAGSYLTGQVVYIDGGVTASQ